MALDLCQNFISAQFLEKKGRISSNFIYAFTLTRSGIGLIHIIFFTFVPELWPLMYAKISFPLNILRTNGPIFTKLYICIDIDKIQLRIVTRHFPQIFTRVMALDLRQNFCFRSISWEQVDRISPNFKYAFSLTRSGLLQSYGPLLVSEFIPDQYL